MAFKQLMFKYAAELIINAQKQAYNIDFPVHVFLSQQNHGKEQNDITKIPVHFL
jgi:hypothetical protein